MTLPTCKIPAGIVATLDVGSIDVATSVFVRAAPTAELDDNTRGYEGNI